MASALIILFLTKPEFLKIYQLGEAPDAVISAKEEEESKWTRWWIKQHHNAMSTSF